MSNDINEYPSPIPVPTSNEYNNCKQKHEINNRFEKFLAYARMGHNRFVRKILYLRQHGLCPVCQKQLVDCYSSSVTVHHKTYNCFCYSLNPSNPLTKVFSPSENGHIYSLTGPCELCYFDHPLSSDKCLNNIILLHSHCHEKIHVNAGGKFNASSK